MIVRRRSRIWTQQPFGDARLELDRSNRLASTITHCLPLNGDYREIVTGNSLTLGAGASRGVDTKGISLKSSGGVACASMPMDLSPYNKLTVSFWLYWDGFANDDQLLMEHGANFVTSIGFLIDPNSSGGGFEAGVGSPGASNNWLAPRPTAAAWHHYYITIDRTTGTGQSSTICIDGVNQALTSNGAALNVDDNFRNDTLYIFSRNNSALFGAGKLQNVIFRGGYIGNPREALEEYLNPRQIFAPQTRRRLISAGAGGPTAYTLDSQPGSVTVVGSAATLKSARKLSASPGAVSIVGASATLKRSLKLSASAGTVAIAGASASLKVTRKLSANAGAVTIAGATAELVYTAVGASPVLNAESGSIAISGATATLKATRKLSADAGSITIVGASATMVKYFAGLSLNAQPGAVTIAGAVAGFRRTYKFIALPGSVAITGATASMVYTGATGQYTRAPSGAGPTVIHTGSYRPSNTGGRRY